MLDNWRKTYNRCQDDNQRMPGCDHDGVPPFVSFAFQKALDSLSDGLLNYIVDLLTLLVERITEKTKGLQKGHAGTPPPVISPELGF